jgi:glycosyltransferase involved in cell wall biosynthesis
MPNINILIPVFNAAAYLPQTIESVLAQTYPDWEMFVVDDCSQDDSYAIACEYASRDTRITAVRNEHNLGMMKNWNKGIGLCQSVYFAKLDADDWWHPNMLEASLRILEESPRVGMVCTAYQNVDSAGQLIAGSLSELPSFAKNKAFSCVDLVKLGASQMLQYNILRQGISLIRRRIFEELGKYTLIRSADTELYFRIGCHYLIHCIDQPYYFYRTHPESDSAKISTEGLREQLLYEVKRMIVDYYFQQGKITAYEKKQSVNDTQFLYNSFLIYKNRITGRYPEMLKLLLTNFLINPKRMLIENLHVDRLFK